MKYLIAAFWVYLCRQLRSAKTWILLIMLPLLAGLTLCLIPREELSAPVQVGVCLPQRGGEAFWDQLESRSGTVITFIPADEATVDANVASGRWDCGVILPKDFAQRLEDGETEELITLRISQASTVYPLVEETLSACLLPLVAPDIAREYLRESGIARDFSQPIDQLGDEDRVQIVVSSLDGQLLEVQTAAWAGMQNLLLGIAAIVLLVWMLFSAMDLGSWAQTDSARRMSGHLGWFMLVLPKLLSALLPALVSGQIAAWIITGDLTASLPLLAWAIFLGGAALLCAGYPCLWQNLPVVMPFVPLICLVLSPVLFDIGSFSAVLGSVSAAMPLTLLLEACRGETEKAGILILVGILLAALAALKTCPERKRLTGKPADPMPQ